MHVASDCGRTATWVHLVKAKKPEQGIHRAGIRDTVPHQSSGSDPKIINVALVEHPEPSMSRSVAYLRTVPPIASTDLPTTRAPPAPASHNGGGRIADISGKMMFEGARVSCHGILSFIAASGASASVFKPRPFALDLRERRPVRAPPAITRRDQPAGRG